MADESRVFPEDTGEPLRTPGNWLDEATAEDLLSGLSPDALLGDTTGPDHRSAAEMARLVQVLGALRMFAGDTAATRAAPGVFPLTGAPDPVGELPGEAAALAAFRQARDTASQGAALHVVPPGIPQQAGGRGAAGDGPPLEIGSVQLAGGQGGTGRTVDAAARADRFRWRPLRFGLAAALAGCMLGGAAAVAGLLPSPMGGAGRPGPAVSVSGESTPGGSGASPGPPGSGSPRSSGGRGSGTSGAPSGRPGEGDGNGGQQEHGKGKKNGDPEEAENWWAQMMGACRDYRGGKALDDKRERELEEAANGSDRVAHFCESLLSDPGSAGKESGAPQDEGGGNDDTSGNNGVGNEDTPDHQQNSHSGSGTKNNADNSTDSGPSASPSPPASPSGPSESPDGTPSSPSV